MLSTPKAGRSTTSQEQIVNYVLAGLALILSLIAVTHLRSSLHMNNDDVAAFYIPWYQHIVQYGRWHSLEASYANYNPPYLYMVSFFSLLDGHVNPVTILKLVQVPATLGAAFLFWSICRAMGCSTTRSALAAWLLVVVPEVFLNTLAWGQCDMIHTAWLLLSLRLLIAKRPNWAMFVFGVGVAFKLQAIFVGPVFAALLLSGEMPLVSVVFWPIGYALMMVPAALAGRPISELLFGVYKKQMTTDPVIVMHAANLYELLLHRTMMSKSLYTIVYDAGMLLAAAATVALILVLLRSRWLLHGWRLIGAMAVSLLMEPYLLPKMHDRYFFTGDVFVLLLAMIVPRAGIPAALLQIAAVMAYYPFLAGSPKNPTYYIPAILLITVSIGFVLRIWLSGTGVAGPADASLHTEARLA